jgi:hypothetical protein
LPSDTRIATLWLLAFSAAFLDHPRSSGSGTAPPQDADVGVAIGTGDRIDDRVGEAAGRDLVDADGAVADAGALGVVLQLGLLSAARPMVEPVRDDVEHVVALPDLAGAAGMVDVRVGQDEERERLVQVGPSCEEGVEVGHQVLGAVELVVRLPAGVDQHRAAAELDQRGSALADVDQVDGHRAGGLDSSRRDIVSVRCCSQGVRPARTR